jgi:hypothetical protein
VRFVVVVVVAVVAIGGVEEFGASVVVVQEELVAGVQEETEKIFVRFLFLFFCFFQWQQKLLVELFMRELVMAVSRANNNNRWFLRRFVVMEFMPMQVLEMEESLWIFHILSGKV